MNYQEAKAFIQKVYDVWTYGTIEQLAEIYASDIKANYFGHTNLTMADIENRFSYMRKHHKNYQFTLADLLVDGKKMAMRSHYSADTDQNEKVSSETVVILHLNDDGKVQKLWSMTNVPVNFLERA
ncbi:MAG: nuclear transport factor 2 family protein [Gammaproteobacteria bacterium]|nr:nuclear transport factor 2 family protein [Gammaproteobacteria bacterium]